jgi:hypothetical protein
MTKIDLYRLHKAEYVAPKRPAFVDTKPAQYLAIRGESELGGTKFLAAIGVLYKIAFAIKMASKSAGRDYAVSKLECLWSSPQQWTLAIRTPDFIGKSQLRVAIQKLGVAGTEFVRLEEGRTVQILHVGPYPKIRETVGELWKFAEEHKLHFRGELHEIYLSDPRRVAPERLRTILRHPVR